MTDTTKEALPVVAHMRGDKLYLGREDRPNGVNLTDHAAATAQIASLQSRLEAAEARAEKAEADGERLGRRHSINLGQDMTGEEWYDAEIAPALLAIANKCHERGMSLVATVEYEPGKRGSTFELPKNADLAMHMLRLCALSGVNVDGYAINLLRFCRAENIDTGASMFLRRFAGE